MTFSEPAAAHDKDFPFTLDWFQPYDKEQELELKSKYDRVDHGFEQEMEYDFGLTSHFALAPTVIFEREPGDHLKFAGYGMEARYTPVQFRPNRLLTGFFGEIEKAQDGPSKIEGRVVLSRYGKNWSDLSINGIVERELVPEAETEFLASIGYARPLGKRPYGNRGLLVPWNMPQAHLPPCAAVAVAHYTSYLAGFVGTIVLAIHIWRKRRRPLRKG